MNGHTNSDDHDDDELEVEVASKANPAFKSLLAKWKVQDKAVDALADSTHIVSIANRHKAGPKSRQPSAKVVMRRLSMIQQQEEQAQAQAAGVDTEVKEEFKRRKSCKDKRAESIVVYQKPIAMDLQKDYTPPKFSHSSEEKKLIKKTLKRNFIFADLTDRELRPLVAAFEAVKYNKGEVIIQQGDPGDYFFILKSGKVTFSVNGVKVGRTTHAGASFGELGLLYTCPRSATAKASSKEVEVFRVDQTTFRLSLQSQTIVSSEEKIALLKSVGFLKDLDSPDLKKLSEAMAPYPFSEDEKIVTKGEIGDAFYILQEGKVIIKDISVGSAVYEDQTLGPGEYFGERALATSERRAANVVGLETGIAFSIDRMTFERVLGGMSSLILRTQDRRTLQGIKVISDANLDPSQQTALAQLLHDENYSAGECVFSQGQKTKSAVYLVREGKLRLTSSDGRDEVIESGGYFGRSLLTAENIGQGRVDAPYTIQVMEDCLCGVLTLLECQTIFEIGGGTPGLGESATECSTEDDELFLANVKLEDLERHKILGQGHFGQVWLVSESLPDKSRRAYALKILSKSNLVQEGLAGRVIDEKEIMMSLHHPFIIKLFTSYQDENLVYLLQELVQGGELFSLMHPNTDEETVKMPDESAKFYGVAVADALAYMHRRKIVFRDLKSENVMIDRHGYPIIIDFGFAKYVPDKTFTLCGTPAFLSPEVVTNRGHGAATDHWSLGVLIYEMIAGENPFYFEDMDHMTLFKSIVQDDYEPPQDASPAATEIIAKFLVKEPEQRLGSLARGEQEIFEQNWFKFIDLQVLRRREMEAPWVPTIKDALDTDCFDDWDDLEDVTKQNFKPLKKRDQELFEEFA